ncbi:TetR/AcrR family transcriptional regulator [Lichenifustis flavocetrariae]|uniref:TetR/AcrR family transcriptional regulator n=1 Tax=Lichenifustis flavocetrariae TaxID=2949735 RepID=A0AA41YQM6_9HYPH|nr:TetR/AcrR family transcriptional regulator [Lichenifustis flavocetrariae]MCW6506756.1 TetR/AcrR family transcriptional regulator [Lichenifustis flavocetrariae]
MVMTKRTQGRPPRDSGINGREKLIEATRLYLQSSRKLSLTRSEIAQGCGVTPALISYYFKDKRSLLDAVTKPLIKDYRLRINAIMDEPASASERMRHIIRLLVELSTDNAFLIDHLLRELALDQLEAEDRAAFDLFHDVVSTLIVEQMNTGLWRPSDPVLAELALWGMCRALGEAMRMPADPLSLRGGDEGIEAKIDYIYRSFAADTNPTLPARPVASARNGKHSGVVQHSMEE